MTQNGSRATVYNMRGAQLGYTSKSTDVQWRRKWKGGIARRRFGVLSKHDAIKPHLDITKVLKRWDWARNPDRIRFRTHLPFTQQQQT